MFFHKWANVVDDVDGDFLVLEVPPSLTGSVVICSLGGIPNPRLEGNGGFVTQKWLVG